MLCGTQKKGRIEYDDMECIVIVAKIFNRALDSETFPIYCSVSLIIEIAKPQFQNKMFVYKWRLKKLNRNPRGIYDRMRFERYGFNKLTIS